MFQPIFVNVPFYFNVFQFSAEDWKALKYRETSEAAVNRCPSK